MHIIDKINTMLKSYLQQNTEIKTVDNESYFFDLFMSKLKIPDDLPAVYYNFNDDVLNSIDYKPSFSTREVLSFKLYVVDNYTDYSSIHKYINYILSFPNYVERDCNVIIDKYYIKNKYETISEQNQFRIIEFSVKIYHYNQYLRGV